MRKWCVECRHAISLEQARARKMQTRQRVRLQAPKNVLKATLKLNKLSRTAVNQP
jgi:hypothetical protein